VFFKEGLLGFARFRRTSRREGERHPERKSRSGLPKIFRPRGDREDEKVIRRGEIMFVLGKK